MKKKLRNLNDGEREEILIKIQLCYLRDKNKEIPLIGKIKSVGFDREYNRIDWSNINISKIKQQFKSIFFIYYYYWWFINI